MGSRAHTLAEWFSYEPGDCILEVGANYGDGSSVWFTQFAAQRGMPFYSIDVEPGRGNITGSAEDVLAAWDREPPGFTWADGYDWPYSFYPGTAEQVAAYESRGQKITEEASMASHLAVARCVHRLTGPGAAIVFDDTWRRSPAWRGKGGSAVPYLLGTGEWDVLEDLLPDCVDYAEPSESYVVLQRH